MIGLVAPQRGASSRGRPSRGIGLNLGLDAEVPEEALHVAVVADLVDRHARVDVAA